MFTGRDWQEFAKRAESAKIEATDSIYRALGIVQKREAEQKELERLRAEAAERAIKEREEAAAKAAKEAAERRAEEQARIAREAAERERQRIENERQRVAAQKKADAEEAEKRAKNRAHRLKIGNEALGAIVALDIPMDRAQDLLIAIAKGAVPHVTISY